MTSHETEKAALCGDKMAVARVISALRKYREAVTTLRAARYADGENDAVALLTFDAKIEDAEADVSDEESHD